MMSLDARVGRALYRAVVRAAAAVEGEVARCGAGRQREVDGLRRAAGAAVPKDLRGLLDVRSGRALPLPGYAGIVARRVADAALSPALEGLEGAAGFAALRHLNARVAALRRMVLPTTSTRCTHGVRVEVASSFAGFERSRFHFRYQIRISNAGPRTIQLLSRAWTIADLDGRVSEVQGPGVVGAFPTIRPRGRYEYTSGVPLQTPMGSQHGHFIFHQCGAEERTPQDARRRPMSDVVLAGEPPRAGDAGNNIARAPHAGKMLQVEVAPFAYRTPSLDDRSEGERAATKSRSFGTSANAPRTAPRGRRRRTDEGAKRR